MATGRLIAAVIIVAVHLFAMMMLDRLIGASSGVIAADVVTYMIVVPDGRILRSPRLTPASHYPVAGFAIGSPDMPPIEAEGLSSSDKIPDINRGTAIIRAAREYLKRYPEQRAPLKTEELPLIFENEGQLPENVRQPGGKIVQWISSQCYLTIRDGELDSGPPYNGARIQKTCVLPKSDGEMLDHLKPEYLRKPVENICPRDVAGCDHKK